MNIIKQKTIQIFLLLSVLIISACTTQLAPRYDRALFEGITQTNTKIMELFASISAGTSVDNFTQREALYNSVIGRIDALAIQSKARPIPKNKVTEKVNEYLATRNIGVLTDDHAPSAEALENISKNLIKMRDKDKADGLSANLVVIFKNAVKISLDQALTYEAFLER